MHKTGNVLNKLPKSLPPRANNDVHPIWRAESRAQALRAFDGLVEKYEAKYPAAVECLVKDEDELLAFYDFPAEHWTHLRTTHPIESTLAPVRLRHRKTKGSGTRLRLPGDGLQTHEDCREAWETSQGIAASPSVGFRTHVCGWCASRKGRRLKISKTQDVTILHAAISEMHFAGQIHLTSPHLTAASTSR